MIHFEKTKIDTFLGRYYAPGIIFLLVSLCQSTVAFITRPSQNSQTIATPARYRRTNIIQMASPTQIEALAQYAPQAASLFNNMKTPAAILAGSLVPLGFLSPLSLETPAQDEPEGGYKKAMRVVYSVVACLSLTSELLAVIWSTVATNQLIETVVPPAESVWYALYVGSISIKCSPLGSVSSTLTVIHSFILSHARIPTTTAAIQCMYRALLNRDYSLEWAATNAHFVAGMWGFAFLIGTRSYFAASKSGALGKSLAGCILSAVMLMIAVVNRGIAAGSGDGSLRFGTTVIDLWRQYVRLLVIRATRPGSVGVLELGSIAVLVWSLQGASRVVWQKLREDGK
jgi:hypothetical protein